MLSDQRSMALVTPDARINWLCLPRLDSPAIFAELIGGPDAGSFSIKPLDDPAEPIQSYCEATMILRTEWPTLRVTDYLDCSNFQTQETARQAELIRHLEGNGRVQIEFAPRLDFGRTPTRIRGENGCLTVHGVDAMIELRAQGVGWHIQQHGKHQSAVAEINLQNASATPETGSATLETGSATLEFRFRTNAASKDPNAQSSEPPQTELERRRRTANYWQNWALGLELPDQQADLVQRSALTLKALCYAPSGAIAAAATTSLPENIGGIRNWDYRYCWIRDAAMSASALLRLGSQHEAIAWLDWLLAIVVDNQIKLDEIAPLYMVDGKPTPAEETLDDLAGYAASRPVRVGNAASRQLQLDVFGCVAELIYQLANTQKTLTTPHQQLLERLVGIVEQRWHELDQGIWEIRSEPRHHIHSKVMCWVTVDRALRVGIEHYGAANPAWVELRAQIKQDVLVNGWNAEINAFTTAYDGSDLDTSALAIGLHGMIEATDRRFIATVAAVEETLRINDAVFRYKHGDGLTGTEGAFNLATSWLIDAKILIGELTQAEALFETYVALAGPTGLIPEEVDPTTATGLGNHPQAYSHLGLINNAINLCRAKRNDPPSL